MMICQVHTLLWMACYWVVTFPLVWLMFLVLEPCLVWGMALHDVSPEGFCGNQFLSTTLLFQP